MQRLSKTFNEITVKKGDVFAIDLDANATTGYLWDMRLTAGKASLVSQNYTSEAPAGALVMGGGGVESFTYKAEQTGTVELIAEYRRPWESPQQPAADTRKFKITVV